MIGSSNLTLSSYADLHAMLLNNDCMEAAYKLASTQTQLINALIIKQVGQVVTKELYFVLQAAILLCVCSAISQPVVHETSAVVRSPTCMSIVLVAAVCASLVLRLVIVLIFDDDAPRDTAIASVRRAENLKGARGLTRLDQLTGLVDRAIPACSAMQSAKLY